MCNQNLAKVSKLMSNPINYIGNRSWCFTRTRAGHGSGFCPTRNWPVQDRVGGFSTRNWPITITNCRFELPAGGGRFRVNSIITGMLRNAAISRQIWRDLARSIRGEIPSDSVRFLANRDGKSLVRPDLVFIVPKIDEFKWKSGWNLETKVVGIWKNGQILNGLRFGSVS